MPMPRMNQAIAYASDDRSMPPAFGCSRDSMRRGVDRPKIRCNRRFRGVLLVQFHLSEVCDCSMLPRAKPVRSSLESARDELVW